MTAPRDLGEVFMLILTDEERRILRHAASTQVDLATSPMSPVPQNPERAERWRVIADAFQMGTPVVYRPPGPGAD